MSVFGFGKGSSWARLPVLRRKCDSGDDEPISKQQTERGADR